MRLKKGFVFHKIEEEYMAVATGAAAKDFNGLVRNNETADFIYRMLQKDVTEEEIVNAMAQRYDAPIEMLAADVAEIICQIREAGFLDE